MRYRIAGKMTMAVITDFDDGEDTAAEGPGELITEYEQAA